MHGCASLLGSLALCGTLTQNGNLSLGHSAQFGSLG
jgi:hypothetical protein